MVDLDTLEDRVVYWQRVLLPLGLGGWDFEVEIVDVPEGKPNSTAAIQVSSYYDEAKIQFCRDKLDDADDDVLDEVIVHELLHAANRDLWDAAMEPEYMFNKPSWTAFVNRLDHETEGFIDRLARSIVAVHNGDHLEVVPCTNSSNHPEHACPTSTTPSSN